MLTGREYLHLGLIICLVLSLAGRDPAAADEISSPIVVGPNVQVSTAHGTLDNMELQVAADPRDANHLIGSGIVMTNEPLLSNMVAAYQSRDGGRTWTQTMHTTDSGNVCDPGMAFGTDGTAYLVVAVYDMKQKSYSLLYRSRDGGTTWAKPIKIDRLDTEFISVDATSSAHRGRVYIDGVGGLQDTDGHDIYAVNLMHSDDHGATRPYTVKIGSTGSKISQASGVAAILSDGTVVVPFDEWPNLDVDSQRSPDHPVVNQYRVAISNDGGDTFHVKTVAQWPFISTPRVGPVPVLAVDQTKGIYKDRLYASWAAFVDGRWQVMFSHSSDKGTTWSRPYAVNDDVKNFKGLGPDDFKPALAVNKDGVVAISWNDRRDNPDDIGWWPRIAVSFDGGDSFTPSVRLSTHPYDISQSMDLFGPMHDGYGDDHNFVQIGAPREAYQGGDYEAIAAGADGAFHPFWEDNRTGKIQIFTARVTVNGTAQRNGSAALSTWKDVSANTWFDISGEQYDPQTHILVLNAAIENASKKPLTGRLAVRLLSVKSILGRVALQQETDFIDFTPLISEGALKHGKTTGIKRLTFHIEDAPPLAILPDQAYYDQRTVGAQIRFQVLNKP
jgi:hypothetical protein